MDASGGDDPRYEDEGDGNFYDFYAIGEIPEGQTNWPGIENNHPLFKSVQFIPLALTLMTDDFNCQKFVAIGESIGRNTVLERLKLELPKLEGDDVYVNPTNREIASAASLDAFGTGLSNNRSLHFVSLYEYDFSRARLDLLSPFLVNNDKLSDLRMTNCSLRLQDIQLLGDAFRGRSNSIKLLSLSGDEINGSLMGGIVEMCNQCPGLKTLCLENCRIGPHSGRDLGALLANPASQLECLRLDGNPIGDEGAYRISGALKKNKKLKKLHLDRSAGISSWGWYQFAGALYSEASLDETFGSRNHILEEIDGLHYEDNLDEHLVFDLFYCLDANKDENKKSAASKKIARFNMSEDFDVVSFKETNLTVLPRVLEWVSSYCKDTGEWMYRSSSYYRILRSFPELCGFPSREKRIALELEVENASLKKKIKQLMREKEEWKSNKRQRS